MKDAALHQVRQHRRQLELRVPFAKIWDPPKSAFWTIHPADMIGKSRPIPRAGGAGWRARWLIPGVRAAELLCPEIATCERCAVGQRLQLGPLHGRVHANGGPILREAAVDTTAQVPLPDDAGEV